MTTTTMTAQQIKAALLEQLIDRKQDQLARAEQGRKTANSDAIEAEGRMHSRYDTMKDEAQYLEAAYLRRLAELNECVSALYSQLHDLPNAVPTEEIRLNSLCRAAVQRGSRPAATINYFIVCQGGGESLECSGRKWMTITPDSPVSRLLLGRKAGDEIEGMLGGGDVVITILDVS